MVEEKYFLMQAKHTNNVWEKGVVIKDTVDEAEQAFHAYLGAYAFNHDPNTDYVLAHISNVNDACIDSKVWQKIQTEQTEE